MPSDYERIGSASPAGTRDQAERRIATARNSVATGPSELTHGVTEQNESGDRRCPQSGSPSPGRGQTVTTSLSCAPVGMPPLDWKRRVC
jgi:hypothetical protein